MPTQLRLPGLRNFAYRGRHRAETPATLLGRNGKRGVIHLEWPKNPIVKKDIERLRGHPFDGFSKDACSHYRSTSHRVRSGAAAPFRSFLSPAGAVRLWDR
jgi:hypothetical protein